MKELLTALLLWISQNSSFDYVRDRAVPQVETLSQEALIDRLLKVSMAWNVTEEQREEMQVDIAAAYHAESNTILVGELVDLKSVYGRAALVHELVHFLQFTNGVAEEAPCLNALEQDAYEIQSKYLRAHGVTPEFDAFTVAARSLCDWE